MAQKPIVSLRFGEDALRDRSDLETLSWFHTVSFNTRQDRRCMAQKPIISLRFGTGNVLLSRTSIRHAALVSYCLAFNTRQVILLGNVYPLELTHLGTGLPASYSGFRVSELFFH